MVVEPQVPHCTDDLAVPVEILQTRWRRKNNSMRKQVKVRWSNSASLGITWEDKDSLKARFPHSEAWGQASSQGEGDVSDPDMQDPLGSHSNDT
uniref:Chromo domain-containing protein n=1 Tax=Triticum urartu TaxID=4572 RepID=A0A8R7PU79_TRIUA